MQRCHRQELDLDLAQNLAPNLEEHQPSGWDCFAALRRATAGALLHAAQALAVMASFVVFGLGWAVLADASPTLSQTDALRADPHHQRLAPDSLTRYFEQTRITPPSDPMELRHAQIERQNYRNPQFQSQVSAHVPESPAPVGHPRTQSGGYPQ